MAEKAITLGIKQISRPADLQIREALRTDHIEDLAGALESGEELPAVHVVREGNAYWLVDGHHRVAAYEQAEVNDVPAVIVQDGTRQDARWLACAANREHNALKRSNQDKRRAVEAAIAAQPKKSARAIAEHVGVSHEMVASIKNPSTSSRTKSKKSGVSESDSQPAPATSAQGEGGTASKESTGADNGDSGPSDPVHGTGKDEPLKDYVKQPIPESLVPVFQASARWRQIATTFSQGLKQIQSESDQPHATALEVGKFKTYAQGAAQAIKRAAPYAVCSECRAEGCENCDGDGWLTQQSYKRDVKDTEAATKG